MRFLTLFTLWLLAGCQYDPHAHTYTTDKPAAAEVAGRYHLTSQTTFEKSLDQLTAQACWVDLRTDGSFLATNVLPWNADAPGTNFLNTLLSASGTWRVASVGSIDDGAGSLKTHWGVYFDSPTHRLMPAGLTGKKPPFGLIFTLGDPDSGEALRLQKASSADRPEPST